MSLHSLPIYELLQSYNALEEEFITRKMMKKHADVVGGYTEHLVCYALGLKRLEDNTPRFDAEHPITKELYQIKGRRDSSANARFGKFSTQRGERKVDFFVGVVFTYDFKVRCAIKIPYDTAEEISGFSAANHALQLTLSAKMVDHQDTKNFTKLIKDAQATLVIDRPESDG